MDDLQQRISDLRAKGLGTEAIAVEMGVSPLAVEIMEGSTQEWQSEDMMGRLGNDPTILTVVAKGMVTAGNLLLLLPSLVVATKELTSTAT